MNIHNIASACKTKNEYVEFVANWKALHKAMLEEHMQVKKDRKHNEKGVSRSILDFNYYVSSRKMTNMYDLRKTMKDVYKCGGFAENE